jgi:hypothetical protein
MRMRTLLTDVAHRQTLIAHGQTAGWSAQPLVNGSADLPQKKR